MCRCCGRCCKLGIGYAPAFGMADQMVGVKWPFLGVSRGNNLRCGFPVLRRCLGYESRVGGVEDDYEDMKAA